MAQDSKKGGFQQKDGLTRLELKVMQVLWRCGRNTVSVVQAEMQPTLAYTTVQTMLNILERKGKVTRALEGRAYVYTAKVSEAKATGQGLRDLVDRMFGGSSEELVMSLLKSKQIDATRLAELTSRFKRERGLETSLDSGLETSLESTLETSLDSTLGTGAAERKGSRR